LSQCATNIDLLKGIVAKLTEIETLTRTQREALQDDNGALVQELHEKLQMAFSAKEKALEAWLRHHREHGC